MDRGETGSDMRGVLLVKPMEMRELPMPESCPSRVRLVASCRPGAREGEGPCRELSSAVIG